MYQFKQHYYFSEYLNMFTLMTLYITVYPTQYSHKHGILSALCQHFFLTFLYRFFKMLAQVE